MEQADDIRELTRLRDALGGSVGLVPTMGALHDGHASLIRAARDRCDHVVASIFVNPKQFSPGEDLANYPRSLDSDLSLCEELGVDLVFTPDEANIYPEGFSTWVEVAGLTDKLCGQNRPGHFRGVTTVVCKLLNIVRPTQAFFGQKDAQQAIVLTRMASDLNLPCEIITCPTVREPDGLALSSRNRYLSAEERARAPSIYLALQAVVKAFAGGERRVDALTSILQVGLGGETDRVDYAEILRLDDLEDIQTVAQPALCAAAVYVGETRLIDNVILDPAAR